MFQDLPGSLVYSKQDNELSYGSTKTSSTSYPNTVCMISGGSVTLWGKHNRSYGHRRGRDSMRRGIGTIRFTGDMRESRCYRIYYKLQSLLFT